MDEDRDVDKGTGRAFDDAAPAAATSWMWTAALVLALIIGIALRLYNVGGPSLWLDEGLTYKVARAPVPDIPSVSLHSERTPPLHYALIHALLQFDDSELTLRLPSVIAGCLTLVAVFWLGRVAFGETEAVLATWLLAIAPLPVMMSQEARAYALATLCLTLAMGFLLRELRAPGRAANLVPYSVLVALAAWLHYLSLGVISLQWLCLLVYSRRNNVMPRLGAVVGTLALFSPCVKLMLAHATAQQPNHHPASMTAWMEVMFVQGAGYWLNMRTIAVWYLVTFTALIAPLIAPLHEIVRERAAVRPACVMAFVFFGWVFGLSLGSALLQLPIFDSKYFIFVSPLFAVLCARAVRLVARRLPLVAGALMLSVCMVGLTSSLNYLLFDEWLKQDWRGAVEVLRERARPDDVILVEPAIAIDAFDYYRQRLQPPGTILLVDAAAAASLTPQTLSAAPRVWLVESGAVMVDADQRVERLLEESRHRVFRWEAWRRNATFTTRASLYEK